MRSLIKKILEILDGTPAVYGKRQRGQSVVELALVSPLLVILLAGLAEIGWFAQNYLTLLEVTRVGARTGTVQQNETSPMFWEDDKNGLLPGSIVPAGDPLDPNNTGFAAYRNCSPGDFRAQIGFYNFLACVMKNSMDPLRTRGLDGAIDPETGARYPDDIIISAFAVLRATPADLGAQRSRVDWPLADANLVTYGNTPSADTPQAVVVGRYPSNANECSDTGERDPFDWITTNNNAPDYVTAGSRRYYLELTKKDDAGDDILFGYDTVPETQVGFVWVGNHINQQTGCVGSDWTVKDVERVINLQGFGLMESDPDFPQFGNQREYVPSQGIVLVELHWKHETLSQFVGLAPVLSPVFAIMGTGTTVSVWAAFPLPTVEPRIKFP